MKSTIVAIALVLGLTGSSSVEAAKNTPKKTSQPKKSIPKQSQKYDDCFEVFHKSRVYIVTETTNKKNGMITSDILPDWIYKGPPKKCRQGQGIHYNLTRLFY